MGSASANGVSGSTLGVEVSGSGRENTAVHDHDSVGFGRGWVPIVGSGFVVLTGMPASPAPCGLLAVRAAIICLWPVRQVPAFEAFEEAAATAGVLATGAGWSTRGQCERKPRIAHRRDDSRAVRRRGGGTSLSHFTAAKLDRRRSIGAHISACVQGSSRAKDELTGWQRAKAAVDRSRNGSTGSAIMAHGLGAAEKKLGWQK